MKRRTVLGGLGGLAAFAGGGYFAFELFAPERTTAATVP